MDIFVSGEMTDAQIARLRDIAGMDGLHVHRGHSGGADSDPAFLRSEVVLGNVPPHWIPQSKTLRWIQLESVGFGEYRELDWRALHRRIAMTNLAGFFAEPVAETALAGILALYRGLHHVLQLQSEREWQGDALRKHLHTLAGARVVLFGQGAINRRMQALLEPFGCDIALFGRDWAGDQLDTALSVADIVVCAVPETDATVGLFDAGRLSRLKPTALFVNVGRGSLVEEAALAERLSDGRLGGAMLDVTVREPLPQDHEFWSCPNLILSQHTGGGTVDETDRKIEAFAANLVRYRAGQPLVGIVDFEKGY